MKNEAEIQSTKHVGASKTDRALRTFRSILGSAKSDNPWSELKTLNARSHGAYRDNTIAGAIIGRLQTNIVGTGIAPRPAIDFASLGISKDQAKMLGALVKTRFDSWAENPNECDIERTQDFYQYQGLIQISALLSGDVFCSTPSLLFTGMQHSLKLQAIEATRVCNKDNTPNSKTLYDGVVFTGVTPTAYQVRTHQESDDGTQGAGTWETMDAFGAATGRRRVLHVWNEKTRPGQVRGVPFLAPILKPLRLLDRWGEAELLAAVVSSMFTVFLEKEAATTEQPFDQTTEQTAAPNAQPELALEAGSVLDLAPGEKAVFANPTRPSANFDPFFQSIVKSIGACLQIPLDELMLHYQSSYSAARAAMLQAWRFYQVRRWWLIQQFCQPVYELFIDEQVASGAIDLPGYAEPSKRAAYCKAHWIGSARGAMDELKEAQAAAARVALGVSNLTMETMAMTGEDYEEVTRKRADELAIQDELGIRDSTREPLVPTMPQAEPAPPPEPVVQEPDPAIAAMRVSVDSLAAAMIANKPQASNVTISPGAIQLTVEAPAPMAAPTLNVTVDSKRGAVVREVVAFDSNGIPTKIIERDA